MRWYNGRFYLCKSDLNKDNLRKIKAPIEMTIADARRCFYRCIYKQKYIVLMTGVSFDKRRQRHTEFVSAENLIKCFVEGI